MRKRENRLSIFFFFGFVSLCVVKSFFIKLEVLVRVGSPVTLFRYGWIWSVGYVGPMYLDG